MPLVIGKASQNIFIKVYVLLMLSFFFWVFTLCGVVVLGIGPAYRTIAEVFDQNQWEYRQYHFKDVWAVYKKVFKQANLEFWGFAAVSAILGYNLYLALQLKVIWMLVITFILIFALLLVASLWLFLNGVHSHYDVSFKPALRLAAGQFFASFPRLLLFWAGLIIIIVVSAKWPGLILFLSVPGVLVWTSYMSTKWYKFVDKQVK
ncbi:YesL family protein [Lacticaseibacillus mingshuiensis]|uniref:YesL family protein n=1 Tax=Lacticaseibacillus mingshuiensis TaxID=2799574 RepID=A0ABW4CGN8_9LACO